MSLPSPLFRAEQLAFLPHAPSTPTSASASASASVAIPITRRAGTSSSSTSPTSTPTHSTSPPSSFLSRSPGSGAAYGLYHSGYINCNGNGNAIGNGTVNGNSGNALAGPSRPRQRSGSGTSAQSTSPRVRSAPTSPSGRARPGGGIAPLSVISPIHLGRPLPAVQPDMGAKSGGGGNGYNKGWDAKETGQMMMGQMHTREHPPGLVQGQGSGQFVLHQTHQLTNGGLLSSSSGPHSSTSSFQNPMAPVTSPQNGIKVAIGATGAQSRGISHTLQQSQSHYDPLSSVPFSQHPNAGPSPARLSVPLNNANAQSVHRTHSMPVAQTQTTSTPVSAPMALPSASAPTPNPAVAHRLPSQPIRQFAQTTQSPSHAYQQPHPGSVNPALARPYAPAPTPQMTNAIAGPSSRPKPRLFRSRSRSRAGANNPSGSGTSGSETETGMDSDTTLMPGRKGKGAMSQSQPDLVALRSRLEGWAGDVARQQGSAGMATGSLGMMIAGSAEERQGRGQGGQGSGSGFGQAGALAHQTQHQRNGQNRTDGPKGVAVPDPSFNENPRRSFSRRASGGKTPPSLMSSFPISTSPGRTAPTLPSPGKSPTRSFSHLSSLRLSPVNSTINVTGMSGHPSQMGKSAPLSPGASGRTRTLFNSTSNSNVHGYSNSSDSSLSPRSFGALSALSDDSLGSMRPLPVGMGHDYTGLGLGLGGTHSSEDADDSLDSSADTSSPSSGSLSFAPRRRDIRRRHLFKEKDNAMGAQIASDGMSKAISSGLGLSFEDEQSGNVVQGDGQVSSESKGKPFLTTSLSSIVTLLGTLFRRTMFSLRLLAVFPAVWGWLVLMHAAITGGLRTDVYPWGVDTSREALDRLVSGRAMEGVWGEVERGDMLLASAWAILTGHFCFEMTTGLTRRWRVYYDLAATITRLLSIQCICWPLTGLTLWVLGHERVLFAWVVIGVTTAASRSVQMYVTSNIPVAASEEGGGVGVGEGGAGEADRTPRKGFKSLDVCVSVNDQGARDGDGDGEGDGAEEGEKDGWWTAFKMGRRWDWDGVGREVGWKVGGLLLITCAWLFWGIESGRYVRSK